MGTVRVGDYRMIQGYDSDGDYSPENHGNHESQKQLWRRFDDSGMILKFFNSILTLINTIPGSQHQNQNLTVRVRILKL